MSPENDGDHRMRLQRLEIENFKGIDHLVLAFPQPRMPADPDVLVMGSRNGLGKTSVLEACTILLSRVSGDESCTIPSFGNFVRSGANESLIRGTLQTDDAEHCVEVTINRSGMVRVNTPPADLGSRWDMEPFLPRGWRDTMLQSMDSENTNPIILHRFLYFHSHRKVREGNQGIGLVSGKEAYKLDPHSVSFFKLKIVIALMAQAGLFDNLDHRLPKKHLEILNRLVKRYAGGTIDKLRSSPDNTLEIRVSPAHGGESFPFDGLSSGQKEILSTLFLVWSHTHDQPGIVLIDEPELHLNAEWHRDFVRQLHNLVPGNQYILATHSEDVFGSVPKERRILLAEGTPSADVGDGK